MCDEVAPAMLMNAPPGRYPVASDSSAASGRSARTNERGGRANACSLIGGPMRDDRFADGRDFAQFPAVAAAM